MPNRQDLYARKVKKRHVYFTQDAESELSQERNTSPYRGKSMLRAACPVKGFTCFFAHQMRFRTVAARGTPAGARNSTATSVDAEAASKIKSFGFVEASDSFLEHLTGLERETQSGSDKPK